MIIMKQKTVLISSNYAWTIFNFRMGLIKRLKKEGYRVVVLTQFDDYEKKIIKEVDEVIPLFISRKGINPFIDIITLINFIKVILKIQPSYILLFTIKPVIYGSLAARYTNSISIPMITGLGTSFIKNSIITTIVKKLYKLSLISSPLVFFQNHNDKEIFLQHKLIGRNQWKITPGSGVDLANFSYIEANFSKNLTFLFVGRILKDKGVLEFFEAAKIIKKKYPETRFQLLGPIGSENRTAIPKKEVQKFVDAGFVEYLGITENTSSYIKNACCIVLPSYREGTSKALLEGAAVGRPLIASDVPGCREIIDNNLSGFLCKPRDGEDLAKNIEKIIKLSFEERLLMGKNGRFKMEKEYDQEFVFDMYIEAIQNIQ